MDLLRKGSTEEIQKSIETLFREVNDRGLIFAPGCVLPQDVPSNNLNTVGDTINSLIPI